MISNETNRISYPGNGSTTVFAYTFKIFETTDIAVNLVVDSTQVTTLQTITTHYTVDGEGEDVGGNVTFVTAPPSGTTVVLTRNQPLTQETDYTDNDPFPAETHEAALDRCMAAIQQLSERLDRAIGLPISSPLTGVEVPITASRAGYYVKVNSTGTGLELVEVDTLSGTFADVSSDSSPSLGGDLDCAGYDILVTGGSTFLKESTDSNKYLGFTKTVNAVNYFNFTNTATGSGPVLAALGSDTNIDINLTPKGTGSVICNGAFQASGLGIFNAGLYIKNGATGGGFASFYEDSDNGTHKATIACPSILAADYTLTLPTALPSSTKFVTVDVSGNMAFSDQKIVQRVYTTTSSSTTSGTSIPVDNSIPQNTEGEQLITLSITPTNASNILLIEFYCPISDNSAAGANVTALFQDSTANALNATITTYSASSYLTPIILKHLMVAGTTTSTTFKIRFGPENGAETAYINRSNTWNNILGTACVSYLAITEYAA